MGLLWRKQAHKPYLNMIIRCCIILILIWVYRQVTTNSRVDVSSVGSPYHTVSKHNVTQASLGQAFFRHLIHDNDSFKYVNEHNICSLIHFFFQEAAHNGKPIQFSSG
jgi:hypothetical protein